MNGSLLLDRVVRISSPFGWRIDPFTKKPNYKSRVVELVKEQYSVDDEIGLTNDCTLALMAGETIPTDYVTYREFVEMCKDIAHLEVFEVERT